MRSEGRKGPQAGLRTIKLYNKAGPNWREENIRERESVYPSGGHSL